MKKTPAQAWKLINLRPQRPGTPNPLLILLKPKLSISRGRRRPNFGNPRCHGFTGVDDPCEPPADPELECSTATETLEESVENILAFLTKLY